MQNRNRWKTVKRDDFDRVLVTETLPQETPIIFSGDGLYEQVSRKPHPQSLGGRLLSNLVYATQSQQGKLITPYSYDILKGARDVRPLTVVHPRSQWRIRRFYESYEALILYYCSLSPCSIRAPHKQTSSFYIRSNAVEVNRWKTGSVATHPGEVFQRYSPSFFSYRGFDRLHKFFESPDFTRLEKKYDSFWSIDISRCFPSIYTHSLSWAVKDKRQMKDNLHAQTFGKAFDDLMQSINSQETNGLVIGPEVSRIFAEIILQSIDLAAIKATKETSRLVYGDDYEIRRYVDDIYIFAHDESAAGRICNHYCNALSQYNLQTNPAKTAKMRRPFVTVKSRVTHEAIERLDSFCAKFLKKGIRGRTGVRPREITSIFSLSRSFIESIKSLCAESGSAYPGVSSFIIGRLLSQSKDLIREAPQTPTEAEANLYRDVILLLMEVSFFMYTVAPSIPASYRLSALMITLADYSRDALPDHYELISEQIYRMVVELVKSEETSKQSGEREGFDKLVPLEVINILLATCGLGSSLKIPEDLAARVFGTGKRKDYFHLTTCLFYMADDLRYAKLRQLTLIGVDEALADLSDVQVNAEKACLFLDMLSCPHVPVAKRHGWVDDFHAALGLAKPDTAEVAAFLANTAGRTWFVNWKGTEMLNLLEKRELVTAY